MIVEVLTIVVLLAITAAAAVIIVNDFKAKKTAASEMNDDANGQSPAVFPGKYRTRLLKVGNMEQSVIDKQMAKIQDEGWTFTFGNHQYVLFRKYESEK